jgi:hypothetical protein
MATNYPNSLDSLTNPATTDPVNNPSHAIQHANANDAIEALQAKVGTDNSAVTTSIDYRVRQLELNPVTSTADKIEQTVVNGGATTLLKSQVVYASGSVGASGKLRVSLSSNAAESTSTKTFGILAENIIAGGEGLLVSEGLLEGIDTTGAADGDPVFLGSTPGSLLFGLANKPVAPAHLVFLGIVVRGGQANTGSIFVKIQNGFELDELHDVSIVSKTGNDILSYDSATGLWKNKSFNTLGLATQTYVDTAVQNLSNASDLEYVPIADVGQIDGVASLDSTGNVPLSQLGNLVDGAPTALDTLNELAAALGDNPNYATDITTALGNKVSKSGGDTITTSSASVKGLIVKGSASQTANLQEWQNSSGTLLASVNPSGAAAFASTVTAFGGFSTNNVSGFGGYTLGAGNAIVGISTALTNYVGIIVKGVASQTVNLQEWQNSSGTVLANIASTGQINANAGFYTDWAGVGSGRIGSAHLSVAAQYLGNIVSIFKGASGQTANLTEWQNSSGTVLAKVTSSGSFNAVGLTLSSTVSGDMFVVDPTYGGITSRGGAVGFVGSASLNIGTSYNAQSAIVASGFSGQSVPTVIIKAVSSQTGNLTEWQDSAGTLLGRITASGVTSFYGGSNIFTGDVRAGTASYHGGALSISARIATEIGTVVRGAASQTANLQEWQNSSGTVLAKINNLGGFKTSAASNSFGTVTGGEIWGGYIPIIEIRNNNSGYSGMNIFSNLGPVIRAYDGSGFPKGAWNNDGSFVAGPSNTKLATLSVYSDSASTIGSVVRAAASQTANLQEWQLSDGTVIASISKLNPNNNSAYLYVGGGSDWKVGSNELHFGRSGGTAYINHPTSFRIESVYGGSLNIKGAVSQTANLQEWQNSSGTVLAKVDVNGAIKAAGLNIAGQEVSSNINLLSGYRYFVNTTAARTLTLPASPLLGDEIQVFDASGTAATNNVTINSNSGKINGSVQDAVLDVNGGVMAFIYTGSTYGWRAG